MIANSGTSRSNNGFLLKSVQGGRNGNITLTRAMLYHFWRRYGSIGVAKLLGDALNFAAPFLLQALLRYEALVVPTLPQMAS